MNTYAAGWALQSPALNHFKRFLRLNEIYFSGIVYPKRIINDLDGIPILDFDTARATLAPVDQVVDCYRPGLPNPKLSADFQFFFEELGIQVINVSEFIAPLIDQDLKNQLRFPVPGIASQDIRELREEPALSFYEDGFADLKSHAIALRLDEAAKASDWDRLLSFDHNETSESELLEVITDIHAQGISRIFRVLDTPRPFLDALLRLKTLQPEVDMTVELGPLALEELGPRLEFYRRSLRAGAATTSTSNVTYLAGSMDAITETFAYGQRPAPSVFFMRRSIVDYRRFRRSLGTMQHRIMLRQPDTAPSHLIAALLV